MWHLNCNILFNFCHYIKHNDYRQQSKFLWKRGDVKPKISRLRCAALEMTGWRAQNKNAQKRLSDQFGNAYFS